jgi:hypothetical protein
MKTCELKRIVSLAPKLLKVKFFISAPLGSGGVPFDTVIGCLRPRDWKGRRR